MKPECQKQLQQTGPRIVWQRGPRTSYKDQLKRQRGLAGIDHKVWEQLTSDRDNWRTTSSRAAQLFEVSRRNAMEKRIDFPSTYKTGSSLPQLFHSMQVKKPKSDETRQIRVNSNQACFIMVPENAQIPIKMHEILTRGALSYKKPSCNVYVKKHSLSSSLSSCTQQNVSIAYIR